MSMRLDDGRYITVDELASVIVNHARLGPAHRLQRRLTGPRLDCVRKPAALSRYLAADRALGSFVLEEVHAHSTRRVPATSASGFVAIIKRGKLHLSRQRYTSAVWGAKDGIVPDKPMLKGFNIAAFLAHIDRNAELRGIRIVYYDGNRMSVIREGPPICRPDLKALVVKKHVGDVTLHSSSAAKSRESKLYTEVLGAALSCSAALVGWIVVGSSAGVAPVTGGASTFVAVLAVGATLASSAQCLNSGVRIYNEISRPEVNDWLDSQDWYMYTSNVLDGLSLVGAGAAAATTVRMVLMLRRTTGKATTEVLKGLSRHERKRVAEEVIRLENPGISNSALKAFIQAGKYPKRFSNLQISNAVRLQLKDALGAALSFTGSAAGGLVSKGGGYVVGMARSVETY